MHVQSCCFANLSPLLFAILVAVAVVVAGSLLSEFTQQTEPLGVTNMIGLLRVLQLTFSGL